MDLNELQQCEAKASSEYYVGGATGTLSTKLTTRQRLQLQLEQAKRGIANLESAIAALDANPGIEDVLDKLSRIHY